MPSSNEDAFREREMRRYVRIDDDIILFWREVNIDEIPKDLDDLARLEDAIGFLSLSSQMWLLSLETSELLEQIQIRQPLLAEYLKVLERKVDALAGALTSNDNTHPNLSTRNVNLSASGLAFLTEIKYSIGTLLELKMILPSSQVGIVAYGRVIHYIPYVEGEPQFYRIGVDFILIQEHDRKVLMHHVEKRKALFDLFQKQIESV